MSDIDNQDFYDGSSADAPLIDSLGSAVKRLIDKGKVRGYITVEELNKALPSEKESSEQILQMSRETCNDLAGSTIRKVGKCLSCHREMTVSE